MSQRRGFGVGGVLLLADVGSAQDVQALRVGRHQPVLDTVWTILTKWPAPFGPQWR